MAARSVSPSTLGWVSGAYDFSTTPTTVSLCFPRIVIGIITFIACTTDHLVTPDLLVVLSIASSFSACKLTS